MRWATSKRVPARVAVVAVAFVVAGCATPAAETEGGGDPASGVGDLLGAGVELVEGEVDGQPLVVPEGARVTLLPADGDEAQVGGVAACNHYGVTMQRDGDRIHVPEEGASRTEMACEPAIMAAEETYLAALHRLESASWDDDRLTLTGDGVRLVFTRVAPVESAALVDTTWRLESLVEGDTASSVAGPPDDEPDESDVTPTLLLGEDGTLTGGTGCRALTGRYAVSADEVRTPELAAEGECPAELRRQDEHMVEVLGDGFRAEVDGDVLTLTSTRGTRGLVYRSSSERG